MNILTITGCSGSGKNYLTEKLIEVLKQDNINVDFIVSYTTRPIRKGEENGKDYHFINREKFEEKIKNNELLEYVEVNGNYYGTPLFNNDKLYIHIVDPKGVISLKKDKRIITRSLFLKDESNGKLLLERLQERINNSLTEEEKQSHIKRIEHLKEKEIPLWNNSLDNEIIYNKILSIQHLENKKNFVSTLHELKQWIEESFINVNKNKIENDLTTDIENEIQKNNDILKKLTPLKLITIK